MPSAVEAVSCGEGQVRVGVQPWRVWCLRNGTGDGCRCGTVEIYRIGTVYTARVSKHLIDVDEEVLGAARAELGTSTIKDTVNEALRRATSARAERIREALDVLAAADVGDREEAWR